MSNYPLSSVWKLYLQNEMYQYAKLVASMSKKQSGKLLCKVCKSMGTWIKKWDIVIFECSCNNTFTNKSTPE